MKKTLLHITLVMSLFGCEELEQPNLNQSVVEGFLIADFAIDDIKVKETVTLNEDITDIPITNAMVRVISDGQEVLLDYSTETGKYFDSEKRFSVEVGKEYEIEIGVDGTVATSTSIVPERPTGLSLTDSILIIPPLSLSFTFIDQFQQLFQDERITLSWDTEPGRSYYVVIETQEETIDPILPDGIPQENLDLISSFRFISEPSEADSFTIIAVALETYGRHVAKVYSVNEEYVDIFNSETQDSRDLNEPPSNINNGLGIFTAFAVDSLEFTVVRR